MKKHINKIWMIIIMLQVLIGTQYAESHVNDVPQPSIDEIIRGLNEHELVIFNEELGVNARQLFDVIVADNNDVGEEETVQENFHRYSALTLFIAGTVTLYLITRYGSTILEYLFNLAQDIPNTIHRSISGVIRIAAESGRIDTVYNYTIRQSQQLLNDPNTANRVVNAIRKIQELRNT